jgi:glutamate dehydrogenase
MARAGRGGPIEATGKWLAHNESRLDRYRRIVDKARSSTVVTLTMLAQLAAQARILLERPIAFSKSAIP